ncbi:MAG: MOSC domain-containing protein [Rhizobiaceae bacterium]
MLKQIYLYPIKGLPGQQIPRANLEVNQGIIGDRQYALTLDPTIDGTEWRSSRAFLINAVTDGLLTAQPDWSSPDNLCKTLPEWAQDAASTDSRPRLVERTSQMQPTGFWDYPDSQLSIMNLNTLEAVSRAIGAPLDMRRFRGNLIIDGLEPWSEFGLAGWRCRIGEAEVEFGRPARRCAATAVNPDTGLRDLPVNNLMVEQFGHGYFGIYARVVGSGAIQPGDTIKTLKPASKTLQDAVVQGSGPPALWPKLAHVKSLSRAAQQIELALEPTGHWPLAPEVAEGDIKLHLGAQKTVRTSISSSDRGSLLVTAEAGDASQLGEVDDVPAVVVTGPYRR